MEHVKNLGFAFLFGGLFCAVGQVLTLAWTACLGSESMLLSVAILCSMGFIGMMLYILGLHQVIAKVAGTGAMLPFNGFAAALGDIYLNAAQATGSQTAGIKEMLKLLGVVLAAGCGIDIVLSAIVFFI